jgi:hypothetical protein
MEAWIEQKELFGIQEATESLGLSVITVRRSTYDGSVSAC